MPQPTTQHPDDLERRVAALENRYGIIERQLDDIRTIITSGLDVLFTGNTNKADALRAIFDRLDRIDEQLTPAFFRVFPRQREFLDEIDSVLRRNPRSDS